LYTGIPTYLPRDATEKQKMVHEIEVVAIQMAKMQQMFSIMVTISKLSWLPTLDNASFQDTLQSQIKAMLSDSYPEYIAARKPKCRTTPVAASGNQFPVFFGPDSAFTAMNPEQYDQLYLTTMYFIKVCFNLSQKLLLNFIFTMSNFLFLGIDGHYGFARGNVITPWNLCSIRFYQNTRR